MNTILKNAFRFILLALACAVTGISSAQSPSAPANFSADTAEVSRLLRLSQKATDPDSALRYSKEAMDISSRSGYTKGVAMSLIRSGSVKNNISDFTGATQDLIEAVKLGEKLADNSVLIKAHLTLGTTYAYMSLYPKALEYFNLGLEKASAMGDRKNEATLLNNIGNVYYFSGYETDDFGPAIDHYSRALAIYESLGDTSGIIMALDNLGLAYTDQQNFSAALNLLQRSLDLAHRNGDKEDIMFCLYKFGRLYARMKQYAQAIAHLDKVVMMAKELKRTDMVMSSYRLYADIYAEMYDFAGAYRYERKYADLKDTLLSEESSKQMAEMQAKYETEKKEKELVLLKQENMMKEMESSRNRTMAWVSIGGGSVLLTVSVVIGLLLFNRYQIKKKANTQLERQNEIIAQKNKDITDSINYAKRLQRSVIATDAYLARHLPEHFVLYKPKDIVSGDFYWAFSPADNEVIVATADCTGHGVPGAFMSVLGASLLNDIIAERKVLHPHLALNLLRDNLIKMLNPADSPEQTRDGMDITLCRFNFEKLTLSAAAANNPLWIARGNDMLELKADRFPVGIHSEGLKPFTLKNLPLQKGDVIYTFTDGYADQFGGPSGKKFKYKELQALLLSVKDKPMSEQKVILEQRFEAWRGHHEQVDDVTVIGIRV